MGEGSDKQGKNKDAGQQQADHTTALHSDAYNPPLNHRVMNNDGTIKHGQCTQGPKLTDLTIDTTPGHVHQYDVPRQGDSYAERQAALKREMPISNEHFQKIAQKGVEFVSINGGFDINMRNALNEANQSDTWNGGKGHKHVDDLLKYANAHLCDTFYTLRREGNIVKLYDTHSSDTEPAGRWDLNKNDWVRSRR